MSLISRRTIVLGGLAGLLGSKAGANPAPSTGIIFVGASWCPVCKRAAPICKVFADRHGLSVLVASQDARPIEPFSHFVDARDHPISMGVRALPTTLVYLSTADSVIGGFEGYRTPQYYLSSLLQLVRQAEGVR